MDKKFGMYESLNEPTNSNVSRNAESSDLCAHNPIIKDNLLSDSSPQKETDILTMNDFAMKTSSTISSEASDSSDSDCGNFDISWSLKKRKKLRSDNLTLKIDNETLTKDSDSSMQDKLEKFESLKKLTHDLRTSTQRHENLTERRKAGKLIKKIMRNPLLRELSENQHDLDAHLQEENDKIEWNSVKPFLDVNSHVQQAVSHGEWGPKTELETSIDDAIKDGDFEKAELLSDNLADRKFAEKICKAYGAKRCQEKLETQKTEEMSKKVKKIPWMFTAKERWQMKGNM